MLRAAWLGNDGGETWNDTSTGLGDVRFAHSTTALAVGERGAALQSFSRDLGRFGAAAWKSKHT